MKTRYFAGVLAVAGGLVLFGAYQYGNIANAQSATPASDNSAASITGTTDSTPPPPPLDTSPAADIGADAATPPPTAPTSLSPGVAEVVKLVQAGVGEDVIAEYVKNSNQPFNPTADEILYLNDLGISDKVMTALVQHQPGQPGVQPNVASSVPPAPVPSAPVTNQDYVVVPPPPAQVPEPTTTTTTTTTVAEALPSDPPQEQTVSYFYDSMSPYGAWVDVPDYGRCWRPTVAVINPGWRPYCDHGHWVYSDCGWYWASDYSWGWAAFHYGRWFPDAHFGWIWVPHHVWGPSWVSWRSTPDYCGWAPLPPAARFRPGLGFVYHSSTVSVGFDFGLSFAAYTFVPFGHFCDPHPRHYRVAEAQVHNVYSHSTVVNNYTINKTTIVNVGVGRERVARASAKPIPTVSVHEAPVNSRAAVGADRVHQVGREMVVYRPPTSAVTAAAHRPSQTTMNLQSHTGQPSAGHATASAPNAFPSHTQSHVATAGRPPLVQAPPTAAPVQHTPAQQGNPAWNQNHVQSQPSTSRGPVAYNNSQPQHTAQPTQSHAAPSKENSPLETYRNQPSTAAPSSTEKYSTTSHSYYTPPYQTPRTTTPAHDAASTDHRVWGSEGRTYGGADIRDQVTPRQSGAAAAAHSAPTPHSADNGSRRSDNGNGKTHN